MSEVALLTAPVTDADTARAHDTNLIEQAWGMNISTAAPAAPVAPEPGDDNRAEGVGFRHGGEGSYVDDKLSTDDRALLAVERTGRGAT